MMISFKSLKYEHTESIIQMMQEFYLIDNYPFDKEISRELINQFLLNEELGKAWLIYNDLEAVGYVILTFIFSFECKGKIAFIDEFYIKESSRGKGIGTTTLTFIKEQMNSLSLQLLYLEVEHHNTSAQKLYLANHFKVHNRNLLIYKS